MLSLVYTLKFIMPLLVPKVRNLCLKNLINKNVGWQQRSSFLVGVGQQHRTVFIIVRAIVIVDSMGSFEPIDFWKLLNLTCYYSLNK